MNELGRIADDDQERRAYVQHWSDRYVEARSALMVMLDLMTMRSDALGREIDVVRRKQMVAELERQQKGVSREL